MMYIFYPKEKETIQKFSASIEVCVLTAPFFNYQNKITSDICVKRKSIEIENPTKS